MKHLRLRQILPSFKKYLPIILITAFAVALRLYLLDKRTFFDADQEEIAFKAKEVLSGNPVLLGPKTSLGGFSIGPGFTYLWAIFSLILNGNPIAGAYTSVLLGILTIIGVYMVAGKIFSGKTGLVLAFITGISASLIAWDQSPWAPSLFYLSEIIALYGAYISAKNRWGIPLVALGLGLGFQSHFAVFLLILPIVIYLLIYKPISDRKNILVSLLIIFLSVAPVLLYDATHGFINIGRFLTIFSLGREGIAPSILKIFLALTSNALSVVLPEVPVYTKLVLFILIIGLSLWLMTKDKKKRSFLILSYLMLFVPFIIFLFYKSNFSEYYLMSAVIPFVFLLGYLFNSVRSQVLLFLALAVFAFFNIKSFIFFKKPMNLSAKMAVVQKITEVGGFENYGVSISVRPGYGFGYKYLFDYHKASPDIPPSEGQKKIFTITSPPGYQGIESMYEVDGIGLRWEGI